MMASSSRLTTGLRAAVCALILPLVAQAAPNPQQPPANNTIDVLKTVIDYTEKCQWPNGNMYFKPVSPDFHIPSSFVDHPAGMAENMARCYLYTGDPRALKVMRKAIDFLRSAEPHHAQYISGKCGEEVYHGMDAHGCWAQSFIIPPVLYYMITGDRTIIEENYAVIADAYDWHLQHFPFQNNTYNHERLLYWKGFVLAKTVMEIMGDTARAAKYDATLRLWRDSFDLGWFEPHELFSQWAYIRHDAASGRFQIPTYLMPFYLDDRPKVDPFWAYWEYTYTATTNLYLDSWLIDEPLQARQMKAMRSINRNLPRLDRWWETPRYARANETGGWVIWYLLRFMNETQWTQNGDRLYASYFDSKKWPPTVENGFEVSDLIPMVDFAHYNLFIFPNFRNTLDTPTRLGDTLVMGEFYTPNALTRTAPGTFRDAGIDRHDVLYYGERNPIRAMEDLTRLDLDNYRVIYIANREVGDEFPVQSARLINWVRSGGSLVLLDTGTADAKLPWLPEEMALTWTAPQPPAAVRIAEDATTSPLLAEPLRITNARIAEWGTSTTRAFDHIAPGWEVAARRADNQQPVLVHRKLGNGWLCATTMNLTAQNAPQPGWIANIHNHARAISGPEIIDTQSSASRYAFPKSIPVLPHIEEITFADTNGVTIEYPFASNRTTPFAAPFSMKFAVVAPDSGTSPATVPATLLVPVYPGYEATLTIDEVATTPPLTHWGDGDFMVLTLQTSRNSIVVQYQPRGH
ncbi:hypothetical protein CVU37_06370 [candidate division BRC1 bacterium HGW-BRC1-1]|jgi:hypothetical protein|nr:MAG: hypothetical protein CVU37_06370 [candidate division BRC1 bacterium HGW-BRC1-1]